jgi:hypothetical protein
LGNTTLEDLISLAKSALPLDSSLEKLNDQQKNDACKKLESMRIQALQKTRLELMRAQVKDLIRRAALE